MNAQDLMDIIGEAWDTYVYEAAQKPVVKKQRPLSRFILVAAIIGLMSATAASASELLRIWIQHNDTFESAESENKTDSAGSYDESKAGIIEFRMNIEEEVSGEPMPAVEVVPYFITEEDVQRVAYTLFPEGVFYEAEPELEDTYSKAEIQEKIERWSRYSTADSLLELIPFRENQPDYQEDIAKIVNLFLDRYTAMLETAPEKDSRTPCLWTFHKASHYDVPEEELASRNLENDNDEIQANVQVGDVHYRLSASKRNKKDFLISNINVFLSDGSSPSSIDDDIFRALLCRTEEPSEEQIEKVKEKARTILQHMQLGDWFIDKCYVETEEINAYKNYIIHIDAVPVLNGVPALRKMQLTNLKNESSDAPRYYYTDVEFEFSANGDLVYFGMRSPIEIKNTHVSISSAVKIEEQLETAKAFLSQRNFYDYSMGFVFDYAGEPVGCIMDIADLEYNLTRINGSDPLESYYYIPGIKLVGNIRYYGIESGKTYLSRENVTLVILNGEDGSLLMDSYS